MTEIFIFSIYFNEYIKAWLNMYSARLRIFRRSQALVFSIRYQGDINDPAVKSAGRRSRATEWSIHEALSGAYTEVLSEALIESCWDNIQTPFPYFPNFILLSWPSPDTITSLEIWEEARRLTFAIFSSASQSGINRRQPLNASLIVANRSLIPYSIMFLTHARNWRRSLSFLNEKEFTSELRNRGGPLFVPKPCQWTHNDSKSASTTQKKVSESIALRCTPGSLMYFKSVSIELTQWVSISAFWFSTTQRISPRDSDLNFTAKNGQ